MLCFLISGDHYTLRLCYLHGRGGDGGLLNNAFFAVGMDEKTLRGPRLLNEACLMTRLQTKISVCGGRRGISAALGDGINDDHEWRLQWVIRGGMEDCIFANRGFLECVNSGGWNRLMRDKGARWAIAMMNLLSLCLLNSY